MYGNRTMSGTKWVGDSIGSAMGALEDAEDALREVKELINAAKESIWRVTAKSLYEMYRAKDADLLLWVELTNVEQDRWEIMARELSE